MNQTCMMLMSGVWSQRGSRENPKDPCARIWNSRRPQRKGSRSAPQHKKSNRSCSVPTGAGKQPTHKARHTTRPAPARAMLASPRKRGQEAHGRCRGAVEVVSVGAVALGAGTSAAATGLRLQNASRLAARALRRRGAREGRRGTGVGSARRRLARARVVPWRCRWVRRRATGVHRAARGRTYDLP